MTDQNAQTEATTEAKVVIRPNIANYVPAKSGSGKRTHRTDDFVARVLDGKSVDDVKAGAAKLGINAAKWEHLNAGQQRMLIGNAMRAAMKAKEPTTEEQIIAVFGEPVAPYDAEKAAAEKAERERIAAEKKAEREKAKAEKQAAAEAKKAEKADAPADATRKLAPAGGTRRRPKGQ